MEILAADLAKEHLLIEKSRGGDVASFSYLVRLHEERAIHLAYSFLGNMEDARDQAQEAFVKAYEGFERFKANSRFSTWLYRIVVNGCKDFLRKKKVRRHLGVVLQPESDDEKNARDPFESAPSTAPDARKVLMNKEIEQEIHAALEKLPFQQKSVFALRYLEGMSLEEIAETLEISVGAVKAHLWQASQKMKANLSGFVSEEGLS